MLTLAPSAVSALASFLRAAPAPELKPLPRATRRREMTNGELLAYELLPVIPSGVDPIHAVMSASTPDDWVGVPDGVVDLCGLI